MYQSQYSGLFHSESFNINLIRAAVEEYQGRHGGFGAPVVVATHIDPSTFEAQGHVESALDGVVIEVERIARGKAAERSAREQRIANARERLDRGEISEAEFDTELCWA